MIYVFERGSIVFDGSTLTKEQKGRAVAVKELPKPETPEGKLPVLKANVETGKVFYEYIDAPKETSQREIDELKQTVADLAEIILSEEA